MEPTAASSPGAPPADEEESGGLEEEEERPVVSQHHGRSLSSFSQLLHHHLHHCGLINQCFLLKVPAEAPPSEEAEPAQVVGVRVNLLVGSSFPADEL